MNFSPTEEQRMTCEVARKLFAREFPLARLREVEKQGLAAFLPVYRTMGELGLLGIGVPENCGGSGGSWLDLALFGMSLAATLYVGYLTYLEVFVLGAICPWCVTAALCAVAVFAVVAREVLSPPPS